MFLNKEQLDQLEQHITEILPDLLLRNPKIATTIEGILAQHFPRRDEFARLLDEFIQFRQETRERLDRIDQDIHELKGDVAVLKSDVAVLKSDVAVLKSDVKQLKLDVKQLKTDVGRLDGRTLQQLVRERLPIYLSRFALRLRPVGSAEVAELLEEAVEQERISEKEMEDAKLIDAVARGRRRTDHVNIYLAAEISTVGDLYDLDRAVRRAAILERATETPTLPVVLAEEIRQDVQQRAEAQHAGCVVLPGEG
ncbi:MAG: hypothetical protein U0350_19770 [Caldilineaceae bacterium]